MSELETEVLDFQNRKDSAAVTARQVVALQLSCGIDLEAALRSEEPERARIRRRVALRLKRERIRGLQRHWSYDLNRHIALKQVLDRLEQVVT